MRPNDSGSRSHASSVTVFLDIADFIRSRELATERYQVDVLPFQLVTMGQPIADFANELFASDSHRDYPGPGRIGVELSEELQLHPEQSTDAFVLHHPEAKYFNI